MKKYFLFFLALGVLSTLTAIAADERAWTGPGPGGPPGNGPGGPGGWSRSQNPRLGGMVGLDEDQQQLFQQSLKKDSDKFRPLEEKLSAAQKALIATALESDYDEKAVRSKAEAVASIQVEMTLLRAQSLAVVVPTMKAEQKQKVIDSPNAIALLSGAGFGGALGGGPRNGGPGGFDPRRAPGAFVPAGFGGGPGDPSGAGLAPSQRQPRER